MTKLGEKLIAAAEEGVKIAQGVILEAGSFRVSDYRKAIPDWVKIVCAIRALQQKFEDRLNGKPSDWPCAGPSDQLVAWVRSLRYDHRPPLQDRPYDTEAGDFIPPQNDPDYIEAINSKVHDYRTFGQKPDAEKVVTTRGSDIGEAARVRDIRHTQVLHEVKMAVKRGDPAAIARILQVEKKSKPKRSIPSRPFPSKQKRRFGG